MEDKLKIIRGDDAQFTVLVTDNEDLPIDLTDCTVFFTAKRKKNDSDDDAAIAVSVSDFDDPTAGEAQILIPASTTEDLKGDYYWDLQIKYPDGKIQSCLYDILTVVPDITTRTSGDELS